MRMGRNCFWTVFLFLAACCAAPRVVAQEAVGNRFEVASVRPAGPGVSGGVTVYPGGRVRLAGMSLKALIGTALGLSYWQISGGEDWTEKDRYVIEARAPENAGISNFNYSLYDIDDARLRE